jgi:L-ascorbate metabolism protein UlaG (beta-lactamase superfamily)
MLRMSYTESMKITKYEHACVALEEQGQKVIIDPGEFTTDFGPLEHIAAVVVTHNHADHFMPDHLHAIIEANPSVVIFTVPEIVAAWGDPHAKAVHAYDDESVGPFTFRFVGEQHAEIHRDTPRPQNTGVIINNSFYYPGDSFVEPDRDIRVLALPAGAPWMKIGEAMDFITELKPERCFPTHDALLSARGHATANKWLSAAAAKVHTNYTPLQPGESFEY